MFKLFQNKIGCKVNNAGTVGSSYNDNCGRSSAVNDNQKMFKKNTNNNNNSKKTKNQSNEISINVKFTFAIWSLMLTLANSATTMTQAAAVYSNTDFLTNPSFEPICSPQQDYSIESDGKESSLMLEFKSGPYAENRKSCTRILSAPSTYGFIVRLILPKIRHGHHTSTMLTTTTTTTAQPSSSSKLIFSSGRSMESTDFDNLSGNDEIEKTQRKFSIAANNLSGASSNSALNDMTSIIEKLNSTALKTLMGRTCPLTIYSSLDPHSPQWRVDPCQLEDTAPEMEDPVRLFHGRIRIVWDHGNHNLHSKLMVTVLGKGDQCHNEKKHPCLKIGDEPILCISKDLICDGIRHCPYSNEYDSDEDYTMCWKRHHFSEPIPPGTIEADIFEQFAMEVFRNLFAVDTAENIPDPLVPTSNTTTLYKINPTLLTNTATNENNNNNTENTTSTTMTENTTESMGIGFHHRHRNSTRTGLNSDLSKYGPWGYLMLGMLLCGGALLICGLWASASQHAANNERESALQNGDPNHSNDHQSSQIAPPNYEELDPPPAYSVLFPNQKAASSTTLNSLAAASLQTAGAAPMVMGSGTTTTTTTTQATASGSQRYQQQRDQPDYSVV